MGRPGDHPVRDAVLAALTTAGPMSRDQLVAHTNASWAGVHKAIEALRAQKTVRIVRWDMGRDGVRRKPIALFGLGSRPDATMRPLTDDEHCRRRRARRLGIDPNQQPMGWSAFDVMATQLRRAG